MPIHVVEVRALRLAHKRGEGPGPLCHPVHGNAAKQRLANAFGRSSLKRAWPEMERNSGCTEWSSMPDHVHLLLSPLSDPNGSFSIAEIMQAIKGASAHRINRALGRKGKIWEEESFDRVLRREENIGDKLDYILWNPVGAGLVRNPLEYRWLWRDTGELGCVS